MSRTADMSTGSRLTAARLASQLLSGPPAASVDETVRHLLAVQAQDARGARLAIRARTAGLGAADVDRALSEDRSVVITWFNRGTLHLVHADDYWWLHALTTPPLQTGMARRLGQLGVSADDAERAVTVIERSLTREGPLTRAQLRERLAAAGGRVEGQALIHQLALASFRGLVVRGPVVGTEHAYVLTRDWLGTPPPPLDRDTALAELARRYLAGHGPATDRDLAKWAGLPLRDARRGLAALRHGLVDCSGLAELSDVPAGPTDGLVDLPGRPEAPPLPPPRLLGPYEPLLLGWTSRAPILGPHTTIVTVNGLFRAFALVAGRAAATWSLAGRRVTLEPFGPLGRADSAALEADAADVRRFLGHDAAATAD